MKINTLNLRRGHNLEWVLWVSWCMCWSNCFNFTSKL